MNKRPSHPPTRTKRSARGQAAASPTVKDHTPQAPRQFSVRAIVLALSVLMAFIILTPTLRAYVAQAEQQRELSQEIESTQARVDELELAKQQWQDPDFVKAQARQRLNYIMPGETVYRVLDPETVTGDKNDSEFTQEVDPGVVEILQEGPWYVSIWESVSIAGVASHE